MTTHCRFRVITTDREDLPSPGTCENASLRLTKIMGISKSLQQRFLNLRKGNNRHNQTHNTA